MDLLAFTTHAVENLSIFNNFLANRTYLMRCETRMWDNNTALDVCGQLDLNALISGIAMWRSSDITPTTTLKVGVWRRVEDQKISELAWYFIESGGLSCWLPNQFTTVAIRGQPCDGFPSDSFRDTWAVTGAKLPVFSLTPLSLSCRSSSRVSGRSLPLSYSSSWSIKVIFVF